MSDIDFMDETDLFNQALDNLVEMGLVDKMLDDKGEEVFQITEAGTAYFQLVSGQATLN